MHITGMNVAQVDTVRQWKLGTLGRDADGKVYKYVQLKNTTATVAVVAGDAVAYGVDSGYLNGLVVSDVTDAATIPVGAGLVQATIAGVAGTSYFCWIQIRGSAITAQAIGGTPADGDQLMMSTTDKVLTKQLFAGTTPNIAAAGPGVAIGTDVSAKHITCNFPE